MKYVRNTLNLHEKISIENLSFLRQFFPIGGMAPSPSMQRNLSKPSMSILMNATLSGILYPSEWTCQVLKDYARYPHICVRTTCMLKNTHGLRKCQRFMNFLFILKMWNEPLSLFKLGIMFSKLIYGLQRVCIYLPKSNYSKIPQRGDFVAGRFCWGILSWGSLSGGGVLLRGDFVILPISRLRGKKFC